jgi:alpha-D-ribose 1-methylphosphonate 5-triphosphate synthase subunit PhnL
MNTIEVRGLHKSFTYHMIDGHRTQVLRGVDLSVEPGTCTVITGASGSGKSTVLRCIFRSCLPDSGEIHLSAAGLDIDLGGADDRTVLSARRTAMALATQFLSVVPRVSALGLVSSESGSAESGAELLGELGLPRELHEVPPATFSGGERQMLNLALTLARPRPLLLLDEVTASLDRRRRRIALEVLDARKKSGVAMLAVFHDLPDRPGFVDRTLTLRDGTLT